MSWTRKQRITVIGIVILLAALPVLLQIGNVRVAQATEAQQADSISQSVTERHAPNDYDGDGITDKTDKCPTRPETTNDFQDEDGCPDVVATTGAS